MLQFGFDFVQSRSLYRTGGSVNVGTLDAEIHAVLAQSATGARQRIALLEGQPTKRADSAVLGALFNPELAPSPEPASFGYERVQILNCKMFAFTV